MCVLFLFLFFSVSAFISVMTMKPAWKHSHIAHFDWTTENISQSTDSVFERVSNGINISGEKQCQSSQNHHFVQCNRQRSGKFQSKSTKLFVSFNQNIQMGTKSPGTSQRCRLILQHCLAIQLSKPGHTPEDFWMYDSGYMIFQVITKSLRISIIATCAFEWI